MKRVILVMMLLLSINSIKAQNDPVLAGMILLYTEKAEKTLKNQELAMMMQTTGHLWTKEEVEATADLQRSSIPTLTLFVRFFVMQHRYTVFITR